MWKMFDNDIIHCSHCNDALEQPPKFVIPPPPRPPSMIDYRFGDCSEENLATKTQQSRDRNMCEAIPIFDSSLYSNQTLQTSAVIAVFSLLLVLVMLISSLFVWKNKRKVQNFLPCKASTRGPHINGGLPLGGTHAVTYEDPDAHIGHRPLVVRHHHNVELLHGKGIHYPSGYPMTRSPPFLVSSSPGPDPYRSHENVYEELGPGRDSEGESELGMDSGDEFAEDELSWPGERSFGKAGGVQTTLPVGVSTVSQPQNGPYAALTASSNTAVRNSLVSSSSSPQDPSTATTASSDSFHTMNANISTTNAKAASARRTNSLISGMLRHTTGRARVQKSCLTPTTTTFDELNSSSSTTTIADADLEPFQQMYEKRSNLMSLPYRQQSQHAPQTTRLPHFHSLHHVHKSSGGLANKVKPPTLAHLCHTLGSEVERRNRFNAQLRQAAAPVATIFRECIHYPGSDRHCHTGSRSTSGLAGTMRTRTYTHSMERHHRVGAPVDHIEPAYGYEAPVFHENYCHESSYTPKGKRLMQQRPPAPPAAPATYIMPDYASVSTASNASAIYQNTTQHTGVEDGSLGSDSGYSHHTPASSIGQHDYDIVLPLPSAQLLKSNNKLSSALSFGRNRRRSTTSTTSPELSMAHHSEGAPKACSNISASHPPASSPNNNTASSTLASSLQASSEHFAAMTQQNDNNNSSYRAYPEQT